MHRVPGVSVEAATRRYLGQLRVRALAGFPVCVVFVAGVFALATVR